MLGGLLALCSAACFAFNNASVRRAVLTGSIAQGMAITVPLGVPLFFLGALVTGNLAAVLGFSPTALAALSTAGVMHFVWGRYCNYRATRAIGTNLTAPVQQFNLVITLVLAIWLLGEYLTPLKILGIVLVLLGPTFAMQKKSPAQGQDGARAVSDEKITPIDAEKPAAFQPKYAEGYTFSLLSATGYGLSPVLVRFGLENQGVGVAFAGGLVAYVAATAVFALVLLWPGQWKHVWQTEREAAKWFTFSGFLVFCSHMFLYMAMSVAPVTVVSPINRLSILFRLFFSRLLNPKHEVFGGGVVLATVVSMTGAVLLSLSTDLVQSVLPLPEGVVPLLNWRWP
ncbi:MAG TPA: EamA family transporter [Xanthobacteraceae bacterium]|nr:EamA family transporter [Xanthobacteraceae bacterium]